LSQKARQHTSGSIALISCLFFSFYMTSCSDAPLFMGVDHDRGEISEEDQTERPSEPVMVGGTFLTCALLEGEFDKGPAEIGCRIARRDTRKPADLSAFNVGWSVFNEQGEEVVVQSRLGSAMALRQMNLKKDEWHVYFSYPDNSYRQHVLQSTLQEKQTQKEFFFHKELDYFDEDRDLWNAEKMISLGLVSSRGYANAETLLGGFGSGGSSDQSFCQSSSGKQIACGFIGLLGNLITTSASNPSQNCVRRISQGTTTSKPDDGNEQQGLQLTQPISARQLVANLSQQVNPFENNANPCEHRPSVQMNEGFLPGQTDIRTRNSGFPCYVQDGIEVNAARNCAAVWVYDGDNSQLMLHAIPLRQKDQIGVDPTEQELRNTIHRFTCQSR